jgi:hypothetical protein
MASNVLLEMLIIWITPYPKSKFTLHPLNYIKKTLADNISPNGHVDHQPSKSKLKWAKGPFSLQEPLCVTTIILCDRVCLAIWINSTTKDIILQPKTISECAFC